MKTVKYISLFLLVMTLAMGATYAQKTYQLAPVKMQFMHLKAEQKTDLVSPAISYTGRWMQSYEDRREGQIVLTPVKKGEMRWGNYLHFMEDGSIAKGYSAPCGNDTNLHRHEGSFKVKGNTLILALGIHGKRMYRIVESSPERLVLETGKNYKKW